MKQQRLTTGQQDPVDLPAYSGPGAGTQVRGTRGEVTSRPTVPLPKRGDGAGWRVRLTAMMTLLALTLGIMVFGLISDGDGPGQNPTVTTVFDREQYIRDLVNRGLVPSQALDWANPSREAILKDLVNRGLIPNQALDS